jgi:Tfp pilus assembly protein PilN
MTKINLLPPEKIKAKKGAAAGGGPGLGWIVLAVAIPLIVLVAMVAWYFSVNSQVSQKNKALDAAKSDLTDWVNKNSQLQQYKARQEEITKIESTVVSAVSGRIYWARILNDIAIMCPTDVWLTSLNGTGSTGGGSVAFQGYALQCPNRKTMGGTFKYYPDYKPIANWLDRMAQISEFSKVWLATAAPVRQGATGDVGPTGEPMGPWVMGFSSQATLNMDTAAIGKAVSSPSATPSAAPSNARSSSSAGGTP